MSNIFIIGGAGKIARQLAQELSGRGHQVRAMHRHPEQADDLAALGATPVAASLTQLSISGLAGLISGSDVVVFSAGAGGKGGPDMTNAVDGRGLELAVDAAKEAGIRRFLLVSAFPEAGREGPRRDGFENYMRVKKQADVYLAESGLDWIILRPGTLSDEAGTGKVRLGAAIPYGDVPRADVAAVLAELIAHPALSRHIIELTKGDEPVADAVSRLANR